MSDQELIEWYKRVFDEYPSVGLLAFIREVMEQPAATAPIPVYAEHAEKPVAYVADEQPAPAPNANELLPCPHCGETNIDATSYTDASEYWMIYCPSCRILMDVANRTKDEAFALWNKRVAAPTMEAVLREQLAEYSHKAWSGWMKYMFQKGSLAHGYKEGGGLADTETIWIMPAWAVERWQRQMNTPYEDLPESEKESDREEADKMLAIMRLALEQAAPVNAWERDFPPEWDRHPWANWACLIASWSSYDGITLMWTYFEAKPEWGELSYNWVSGTHGFANPVTRRSLRTFFDTKDTLRQRPATAAGEVNDED